MNSMTAKVLQFLAYLLVLTEAQELLFPSSAPIQSGKECQFTPNQKGTCKQKSECSHLKNIPSDAVNNGLCGFFDGQIILCCPKAESPVTVESPPGLDPFRCGSPHGLGIYFGRKGEEELPIYSMNKTAEQMRKDGFTIKPEYLWDDVLFNFTWSNATHNGVEGFDGYHGVAPVGGEPAEKERSYFMALIGQRKNEQVTWHCDGVLINRQWILSAAHCFTSTTIIMNVIRLGELDWSTPPRSYHDNQAVDYDIEKLVFHPKYKITTGYYDLILIKISKPIPIKQHSSNPICLPWGEELSKNHVGGTMVLSGWGATSYQAPKTPRLQQVELHVMDSSVCDNSYSKLVSYKRKYPEGITSDKILCAGHPKGGKDACKGDSGAPLVYHNERKRMFLGGIVHAGHGCGLKDFPGLYIPITAEILQWIKDTAFAP